MAAGLCRPSGVIWPTACSSLPNSSSPQTIAAHSASLVLSLVDGAALSQEEETNSLRDSETGKGWGGGNWVTPGLCGVNTAITQKWKIRLRSRWERALVCGICWACEDLWACPGCPRVRAGRDTSFCVLQHLPQVPTAMGGLAAALSLYFLIQHGPGPTDITMC